MEICGLVFVEHYRSSAIVIIILFTNHIYKTSKRGAVDRIPIHMLVFLRFNQIYDKCQYVVCLYSLSTYLGILNISHHSRRSTVAVTRNDILI